MTTGEQDIHSFLEVVDRLLGPGGCPWDQEQTVRSLSHMVLEEVCELIDTLSEADSDTLCDELGDVFVGLFFLSKAAQKEGCFRWNVPFQKAAAKLIRRHPHIFETGQSLTVQGVEQQWETIKAAEPDLAHRTSRFDGIPKSLPALAMTQKLFHKALKNPNFATVTKTLLADPCSDEEEDLGRRLAQIVLEAEEKGLQAEIAVRRFFALCRKELVGHEHKPVTKNL